MVLPWPASTADLLALKYLISHGQALVSPEQSPRMTPQSQDEVGGSSLHVGGGVRQMEPEEGILGPPGQGLLTYLPAPACGSQGSPLSLHWVCPATFPKEG